MKSYFLSLIIVCFSAILLAAGCGKEKSINTANEQKQQQQQMGIEDEDTTALTPAESFATALCQDILNDDSEADFESYLIDVVYPKVSGSTKVTLNRVSSSIFLLTYFEGSTENHLLIQKYFNPQKGEIFFESSETSLSPSKQFLK
ncbi:MAG: hypothetical protein ACOYN6_01610 [Ignavibacteria bacterium]